MDWNVLYSNEKSPSLEQVTEYINNPLWIDFNNRIQSAYRIEPWHGTQSLFHAGRLEY